MIHISKLIKYQAFNQTMEFLFDEQLNPDQGDSRARTNEFTIKSFDLFLSLSFRPFQAAYNWRDPNWRDHTPPSQRYVVIWSTAAVLIYFCILREENDIDEIMYQPLVKTVPAIEQQLIEASISEHRRHGKPTADLEKRLKEIKAEAVKQ